MRYNKQKLFVTFTYIVSILTGSDCSVDSFDNVKFDSSNSDMFDLNKYYCKKNIMCYKNVTSFSRSQIFFSNKLTEPYPDSLQMSVWWIPSH